MTKNSILDFHRCTMPIIPIERYTQNVIVKNHSPNIPFFSVSGTSSTGIYLCSVLVVFQQYSPRYLQLMPSGLTPSLFTENCKK